MADFDGDIVQVIYNQDFINNILETDRIFYNILSEQAKTIKLPYNSSNRFNENIKYCGNLIGSIAILGASIMDKALEATLIFIIDLKEIQKKLENTFQV